MSEKQMRRSGFTLIELLLVVGILALLTAVILPKFDGLQSKVNHGIGAASADDTSRLIVTYKVTKNRYPNGWDNLLDAAGTGMWIASDPTQRGIQTQLADAPISDPVKGAKLSTTVLTASQAASLARMGVTKVFGLGADANNPKVLPGDCFDVPTTLAGGSTVCVLNTATVGGRKMIDSIYPANKTAANPSATPPVAAGVSGALPSGKIVVIFGLGPKNEMIGTSMMDCPFYPNVDLTLVYNRNLVAFEVDAAGGKSDFKGVFGSDGDLKTDMANDMFK